MFKKADKTGRQVRKSNRNRMGPRMSTATKSSLAFARV